MEFVTCDGSVSSVPESGDPATAIRQWLAAARKGPLKQRLRSTSALRAQFAPQ